MSCQPYNLSVLAYANGFTLWHYVTEDATAEVASDGYFDKSADMLRAGDMIIMNVAADGPGQVGGTVLVKSNAGGRIVIGDLTPLCAPGPQQPRNALLGE